ncbi:short-chain dehydrogenase/reductase [Brevundimonas intermedia]|uniref:Short-chain dehydrogenase/reductase n=1 Tax=Brevundimonas intermedia TaxID=74315 RepID=A0ABQ5TA54_9CAUL|nr:oxidoreductase [Brevundimonas intermedia]GLK49702.1 short-chain dehydrogenase/reductase [Brevundimonas intermedia]
MTTPTPKTWLITGAARGLGAAIAQAAVDAGDRVVVTGRRREALVKTFGEDGDALLSLALDVTDAAQIAAAVETAVARFGRIDVLVNNAGYGYLGLFEETRPQDARAQFDTNVFGLFDMTRAVLPVMRAQRSGHVFNVSSVGGMVGGASGSIYCASKFAIEGFSESIAQEVSPFGVHVTIVEPGFFRTDFLDASSVVYAANPIADYAQASAAIREFYDARSHNQAGDPVKLGQALVTLANAENPPVRWAAGTDAVGMIEGKIAGLTTELEAWRDLSQSTDGDFSFREEPGAGAWG